MQKRTLLSIWLLIFGLAGLVASSHADDLRPPDYRGDERSTVAGWDFITEQDPISIQPDDPEVPLVTGDAKPQLDAEFPEGAPYPSGAIFGDVTYSTASDGGYLGGPIGDGVLVFNVPNWIDMEPEKRLRVQVTYRGGEPPTVTFGFLGIPGNSDGVAEVFVERRAVNGQGVPQGSAFFYEDWQMFPNPDWEQVAVFLPAGTFVDQVVIDTVSAQLTTPTLIFRGGFETGDTTEWSSQVPVARVSSLSAAGVPGTS